MKTLIFDYDGVIADTLARCLPRWQEVCNRFGNGREVTSTLVRREWDKGWQTFYKNILGVTDERFEEAATLYQTLAREMGEKSGPPDFFPGITAAIQELSRSCRLFVLSSSGTENISHALETHGVRSCFEDVWGRDKLPDHLRKSDPAYFEIPLSAWGADKSKKTVSISDTMDEIVAGKTLGLSTIGCAWGWQDRELLEESTPDVLIDTAEQLVSAVSSLRYSARIFADAGLFLGVTS